MTEHETAPDAGGPDPSLTERLRGWLSGRIPQDWFTSPVDVVVDREEITLVGALAPPATVEGASDAEVAAAAEGRAREFRERTREARIGVARELEHRTGRKVSWGVRVGDATVMFTTAAVPVMTRLRQPERQVLDTLVAGGVARSRSEALAWCVRLVGRHSEDWLAELRSALGKVAQVRAAGPDA
jgi:hypothetical protein